MRCARAAVEYASPSVCPTSDGVETVFCAGAKKSEIARENLHRGDPSGLDGLHEFRPRREGEILPAPESKTLRVSQIVDCRRPRGRDIDHAGIRQPVLQAQARPALLRGFGISALTLAACGIRHGMAFIEE